MIHATLFVDESGKSSLAERTNDPFLLTGVILNDNEIKSVEGFFNYIKRKYDIDTTKPFHSYHIFEHPTYRLSDAKATSLVSTLAEFISLIPIKITILLVNKDLFRSTLGISSPADFKGSSERKELREFPYRIMAATLFHKFAQFLKKNNAIGQIIADSRKGGDYQLIKTLDLCKDYNNGPLPSEDALLIQNKCTAICFAEKFYLSGGLEITDLISYVSFFHARRKMNSMDHIKLNRLWLEIRKKLDSNNLIQIEDQDIRTFFSIKKGEVHKYLRST